MKAKALSYVFLLLLVLELKAQVPTRFFPQTQPLPGNYWQCDIRPPQRTSDSGYIFSFFPWAPNLYAASPADYYTIKTDSNFVPQWKRMGYSKAIPLPTGGIILVYKLGLNAQGPSFSYIEKVTRSGVQVWIRNFSAPADIALYDGVGYADKVRLVGSKDTLIYPPGVLIPTMVQVPYSLVLDTTGTFVSQNLFNTNAGGPFIRIKRDGLGNFYVFGSTEMLLAKFDSGFNPIWSRAAPAGQPRIALADIDFLPNGGLIATGSKYYQLNGNLMKFDSQGNITAQSQFVRNGRLSELCKKPNGNYVVSYTKGNYQDSTFLFEMDTSLNLNWHKFCAMGTGLGSSIIHKNRLITSGMQRWTPFLVSSNLVGDNCKSYPVPGTKAASSYTFVPGIFIPAPVYVTVTTPVRDSIAPQLYTDSCFCQPAPASSLGQSVCPAQTATLMASGLGTIVWYTAANSSTPVASGASFTLSSLTATAITVYVKDSTCAQGNIKTPVILTVLPSPPITVVSTASAVCPGSSVALTANGAATYTWNGSVMASGLTTTLAAGTIFTVVGTGSNSCVSSSTMAIGVYPNPSIYALSPVNAVCPGDSVTLTGNGAISYTWSNGMTANSIKVAPTNTTVYTVWGTDQNACKSSSTIAVGVYPSPWISALYPVNAICSGDSVTLTGNGAISYTWSNGMTTNPIKVAPNNTTIYTVWGTDQNACKGSVSAQIVVNPTPSVMITSGQTTICVGETATLSCAGANTCLWNSVYLGSLIQVSPLVTTTYVVVGTTTGCSDTAMAVVFVELCDALGIDTQKNATEYISVFPNPTTGNITIKLPTTQHKRTLSLYNTMGQLILEQTQVSESMLIPMENYAPGVYYIRVNADRPYNYRIIKQ